MGLKFCLVKDSSYEVGGEFVERLGPNGRGETGGVVGQGRVVAPERGAAP